MEKVIRTAGWFGEDEKENDLISNRPPWIGRILLKICFLILNVNQNSHLMKTIQIQVPDMQSNHCQLRVQQTVNNLPGIQVTKVQAGSLEVNLGDAGEQEAVVAAIQKAGFTVVEPETGSSDAPAEMLEGETYRFSTNVHCGGCLAQVRPALDAAEGICHWDLDISNPQKILTVHSEGITRQAIVETVQKAGFSIEEI
jgi:copper chaperone CopZ